MPRDFKMLAISLVAIAAVAYGFYLGAAQLARPKYRIISDHTTKQGRFIKVMVPDNTSRDEFKRIIKDMPHRWSGYTYVFFNSPSNAPYTDLAIYTYPNDAWDYGYAGVLEKMRKRARGY